MFTETIDGWASWGRVFQSIDAFRPIIFEIYKRHGLPMREVEHLTPGTNAVFKLGDTVVKIYAPAESGETPDWTEMAGLKHAEATGVLAPRVLASGIVRDKYAFYYMVMELTEGKEAGDVLPTLSDADKVSFAKKLKAITARLNVPAAGFRDNVVENAVSNARWGAFPATLKNAVAQNAKELRKDSFVYVHGDLTAENVLVTGNGEIRLIDFGDSHVAPHWYEWPPLVFDLFGCDPVLIGAYFEGCDKPDFVRTLARAVLLHDFGGGIALDICEKTHTDPASISTVASLEEAIIKRLHFPATRR